MNHLEKGRTSDTNNDGNGDSGSHQWTADAFHTRDQVRQAVVDWMWFVRALQNCGTGTMDRDGQEVVSCDWDQDGTPDIGGPNAEIMLAGGSLGGIVNGVAAAVMPEVRANAPIVAGGGLMDISTNTHWWRCRSDAWKSDVSVYPWIRSRGWAPANHANGE